MFRVIVLCALVACARSLANFRIVNGKEGDIRDFPYLATLQHRSMVRCGATIINERTLITASHCFNGDIILDKLFVRAGTEWGDVRPSEGQKVPVLRYLTHPEYSQLIQNNDIAIVWTKENLVFGPKVKPIGLPAQDAFLPIGQPGVAAGWGRLKEGGPFPDRFHYAILPVLTRDMCLKNGGGGYDDYRITDKMFCAGYLVGGTDACKSDSGGPFVVDNTLIGVVSFGQGCARPKFPGVYANVAKYRDWIDNSLKLEEAGMLDATPQEQEEYLQNLN